MNFDGQEKKKVTPDTAKAIEALVGKDSVVYDENSAKGCIKVMAKSEDDVSKVVLLAYKENLNVVSSNNPAVAISGEKASAGSVFVDLSEMKEISEVDKVAMTLKVQPGAKWADVLKVCSDAGLIIGAHPTDLTSTVGAWAISSDVGFGSFKYGAAKDNISNLKVVTSNSSVIETGYDQIGHYMSGYNLTEIFAGSEGILGVVVSVTLKLAPKGVVKTVGYKFPSVDAMQDAFMKIASHASLKPLDISWCGVNNTVVMTYQGMQEFVDFDVQESDALMAEIGAEKVDDSAVEKMCEEVSKRSGSKTIIPLKNWKDFMGECSEKVYGSVADMNTAFIVTNGDGAKVEEIAVKYGGRSIDDYKLIWDPRTLAEPDDKDFTRTVTPEIISKIEEIVGKKNVTTNGVDRLLYSHDLAPLPKMAGMAFNNIPDVVVRPTKVSEISEIVKLAYKYGIPIVPRGNSTWGLGGCMPTSGGILIDMSSKMCNVMEMDKVGMTVKVGAGCTWKKVLEACMKEGFIVGSYPSSFPGATIGAWISTNGMGVGSYKYGSAKDNVVNMQFVASNGEIVETGYKDLGSYRTAFNLNTLVAGAEGTLAVLGTVTLRMHPMGIIKPLAYEFEAFRELDAPIQKIVNNPSIRPLHIAYSDELHFTNQRKAGMDAPEVKNLLLLTLQGDQKFVEFEESILDELVASTGGKKVDNHIAEHEWSERCYEFRARRVGVGEIPAEVVTPNYCWGEFVDVCYQGFKDMKMEAGGQIGVIVDRNTALFMPYYFKDDESMLGMTAFAFNFYLGDKAQEYGGRTTGFGVFFAWNLDCIHDKDTAQYMRIMKTVMDPHDVINPGHLVCGMTRFGINMSKPLMSLGSNVIQMAKKMLPPNSTFSGNQKRFRYNTLEHRKDADRTHKLGDGTQ